MKVSVIGAGAVGSMIGGLIKHYAPETEMLFVMRGDHGRVVGERGHVQLEGPWGRRTISVGTSFAMEDITGSDYVLFTVKSQATEEAVRMAAPYLGAAILVSIQNGINDGVLMRHVPAQRLVMGMTAANMAVVEPGRVELPLEGTTVVGPFPDGVNADAAANAAGLLRKTGLKVTVHRDVLGARYNKLAINALGYASCLSASNFISEAVCHRPWRAAVGLPVLDECIRIFRKARIAPAKIPGLPTLSGLRLFFKLLDSPVLGPIGAIGARLIFDRKPIVFSLHQDLLRGKSTEVEFINGEIARLAAACGMEAPRNRKVARMVHELEQRGGGGFFHREEVVERFSRLGMEAGPNTD